MAAGKRSDPKKLAKERAAIAADIEKHETPSLIEMIKEKIARRRGRRMGYGAAPSKAGATVIGHRSYTEV